MGRGDVRKVRDANDRRRKLKAREKRQAEEKGAARKAEGASSQ